MSAPYNKSMPSVYHPLLTPQGAAPAHRHLGNVSLQTAQAAATFSVTTATLSCTGSGTFSFSGCSVLISVGSSVGFFAFFCVAAWEWWGCCGGARWGGIIEGCRAEGKVIVI